MNQSYLRMMKKRGISFIRTVREETKYKPDTYQRNVKIYDPTSDLKTCCRISFEMLSSNIRSDSRDLEYLRYRDLEIDKTY